MGKTDKEEGSEVKSRMKNIKRAEEVIVTQGWHEDVYVFVSKKHLNIPQLCQFFSTSGLLLLGWPSSQNSPFLISPLMRFNLLRCFSLFPRWNNSNSDCTGIIVRSPRSALQLHVSFPTAVSPPSFSSFLLLLLLLFSFRGYPNTKRELGEFSCFSPLGTKLVKNRAWLWIRSQQKFLWLNEGGIFFGCKIIKS